MSIGVAIGAITFTGSIIAFLKLDGRMSGKPIMLPMRHIINLALGVGIIVLVGVLVATESYAVFWLIVILSLLLGVLIIIPIGGADMPVVVSMLNSYSGWAAAGIGFTLENLALIITGQAGCGGCCSIPDEERIQCHLRSGLRHGSGTSTARASRDGG